VLDWMHRGQIGQHVSCGSGLSLPPYQLTSATYLIVPCRSTDTWMRWQGSSTYQMHLRELRLPPFPKTCNGQLWLYPIGQAYVSCVPSNCSTTWKWCLILA
jgi:hypothetical protein